MAGIVRPDSATSITAPAKAVMIEKAAVQEERVTEPVKSPAPATPSQAAEKAAKVNTGAESVSNSIADVQVIPRRIIAIGGRTPDVLGIVVGHVDHLGIGRLNLNRRLIPLHLCGDVLLPVGLELTGRHGLGAHPLHGIHYVRLLSKEGVAEIGGPTNVGAQPVDHVREDHQSLDTGVPILLACGIDRKSVV